MYTIKIEINALRMHDILVALNNIKLTAEKYVPAQVTTSQRLPTGHYTFDGQGEFGPTARCRLCGDVVPDTVGSMWDHVAGPHSDIPRGTDEELAKLFTHIPAEDP